MIKENLGMCSFFKKKKMYIYTYIFIYFAALGLHCCTQAFSSCGEWGLFSSCGKRASHCSGFSCCRARVLGCAGVRSCGVWA